MKLTARIKAVPKLTANFKELKMPLNGGFEEGYDQGYTAGYETGNTDGYTKGHTEGVGQGYADALSKRTEIAITENGEYTPSEDSTGFNRVSVNVQADGGSDLDAYITRTITEVNSDAGNIGLYAFTYCTELKKINFPNATSIKSYAFQYCSLLPSVTLPKVRSIGGYAFMGCTALASADIPDVLSVGNYAFRKCDALTELDLHETNSIGTFAFYECSNLERLILRKTDKVCTLSSDNALQYTKIAEGEGFIYVPDNLVDSYKAAANWSTYASQIKPISELEE